MWSAVASTHDAQALCVLFHPLTLSLTTTKVQCRDRNPNPTTLAATRPKRRRVAANAAGLGFLDAAL